MISFALAQELKNAGFTQRTTDNAEYFLSDHLMIRREDALRIWFSDKAKHEWVFDPSEALVYCPTVSELIESCGLPFYLSGTAADHWLATNEQDGQGDTGHGQTVGAAIARLWLVLCSKT
jgi:hypothetical protein